MIDALTTTALVLLSSCSGDTEPAQSIHEVSVSARIVGPSTTVRTVIHAPIEKVFAFAVAEDVLPKVLKRYGPIPPIQGTEILHGPWEREGADRRVLIEGGGTLHEQITHFRRPTYFAYQIDQFEGTPLRLLAKRAVGSWVFTDIGGSTGVEWTYSFEPKSCLAHPLAAAFLQTFYRGFMRQALRLMKAPLEGTAYATTPDAAGTAPRRRQDASGVSPTSP